MKKNAMWRLGKDELEQTREYKYLGMCMSPYGRERMKMKR